MREDATMSDVRNHFANILLAEVGYHEGRDPNGNWNNHTKYPPQTPGLEWAQDQPWCATFQVWGAHRAGIDALWPQTASCYTAVQWWKARKHWTEYPVLGGPLYMGDGGAAHTEVVTGYTRTRVFSVGGNTNINGSYQGDGVYEHDRPRTGAGSPYGYGIPAFPEGTISADPAWGGVPEAAITRVPAGPRYEPFPGSAFFILGRRSPIIAAMHDRLVAVGCDRYASSLNRDMIGPGDVRSYECWQREYNHQHNKGWSGNALLWPPGRETWDALAVPNV